MGGVGRGGRRGWVVRISIRIYRDGILMMVAIDEAVDVYTAWTDKIGYTKEAKDMKPKARRGFGPGAPSKSALAIKSEAFAEAEKKTLARKAKKAAAEEFKDGGYEMGEQGVM